MRFERFAGLLALGAALGVGCSTDPVGTDVDGGTDVGVGGSTTDSGTDSGVGGMSTGVGGTTGGHHAGGGSGNSPGTGATFGTGSSSGSGGGELGGMGGEEPQLPDDISFDYDPEKDVDVGTCAATQVESQEIFLDMFVMLDKSGSMTIKPAPNPIGDSQPAGYCDIGDPNVGSRWCNSINALHGFFSAESSVNTGFSFGEFAGTECEAFDMAVPFGIVEAGDANGQIAALVAELNDDNPGGYTHTQGAIETLIAETAAHEPAGTRRTVAVLITDGVPTQRCMEDPDDPLPEMVELNGLIIQHYQETGVPTFIIGMTGVDAELLDALATGAGAEVHTDYCTDQDPDCSYYAVGDGEPDAFIAALDSIRKAVVGCEFSVPSADVGIENLSTLDVQFTPDIGEAPIGLTRVDEEADCTDGGEDYWVDFPANEDPLIKLCPATCDSRGDGASVDISLKCEGS